MKLVKASVFMTVLMGILMLSSYNDNVYKRNALVTEINNTSIICVDERGNEWELEADDLVIGNHIQLKMDSMNTQNYIYDDEIIDYKILDKIQK